ncbi:metallophosphoesterase family protein [Sinorhizobium meliloti]|uniref:metallophosphoesterase family protein n=1 Tax=Rhizobium meliloti TaxID=382 RepID=UPI00299DA74C|nr:serine/threonine protein phosphatase [Sinorhizobium meliloti]
MNLTFAIGDVHGCLDMLKRLINRIEMSRPDGTVIFLGDYVDRGPDSAGVVQFIMDGPQKDGWKWIALKGNHEDMMVSCIAGANPIEWWIGNGGAQTIVSYGGEVISDHLKWCNDLPLFHTDDHRIYVHAGVDETVPLEEQTEKALLWSRKPPHYSGEYWGKHLCHGHTPSLENPVTVGNRTNVDSGAVFGGKLTCAVFDDGIPGGPIEFMSVSE